MFDKDKAREELEKCFVLLMNKPSLEYLGLLIYGTNVYLKNMKDSQTLAPYLAYTDGKDITILYNHDKDLNYKKLASILCHEMLHIICYHVDRMEDRNPFIWNIAVDHCTNRYLMPYVERNLLEMTDGYIFLKDIHKKNPEITPEELYDLLMKQSNEIEINITYVEEGEEICSRGDSGGDSGGNDNEEEKTKKEAVRKRKVIVITRKNSKGEEERYYIPMEDEPPSQKSVEEQEDLRYKARYVWESSSRSNDIFQKGEMPGELVEELNRVMKPKIPWEKILDSSLLFYSQESFSKSWKSRDYYIRCSNLPGNVQGSSVQSAVFAIDTSGSISTKDLEKFVGVICDSTNYFKKIYVIQHDHKIQKEDVFSDRPDEETIFNKIKEIMGRGGTSHEEVFDRIRTLYGEELISVVVFLTDLESDIESCIQDRANTEWLSEIPIVFVVNDKKGSKKLNLSEEEYEKEGIIYIYIN